MLKVIQTDWDRYQLLTSLDQLLQQHCSMQGNFNELLEEFGLGVLMDNASKLTFLKTALTRIQSETKKLNPTFAHHFWNNSIINLIGSLGWDDPYTVHTITSLIEPLHNLFLNSDKSDKNYLEFFERCFVSVRSLKSLTKDLSVLVPQISWANLKTLEFSPFEDVQFDGTKFPKLEELVLSDPSRIHKITLSRFPKLKTVQSDNKLVIENLLELQKLDTTVQEGITLNKQSNIPNLQTLILRFWEKCHSPVKLESVMNLKNFTCFGYGRVSSPAIRLDDLPKCETVSIHFNSDEPAAYSFSNLPNWRDWDFKDDSPCSITFEKNIGLKTLALGLRVQEISGLDQLQNLETLSILCPHQFDNIPLSQKLEFTELSGSLPKLQALRFLTSSHLGNNIGRNPEEEVRTLQFWKPIDQLCPNLTVLQFPISRFPRSVGIQLDSASIRLPLKQLGELPTIDPEAKKYTQKITSVTLVASSYSDWINQKTLNTLWTLFPKLSSLELEHFANIGSDSYNALSGWNGLKMLKISTAEKIFLKDIKTLEDLTVSFSKELNFQDLPALKNLEILDQLSNHQRASWSQSPIQFTALASPSAPLHLKIEDRYDSYGGKTKDSPIQILWFEPNGTFSLGSLELGPHLSENIQKNLSDLNIDWSKYENAKNFTEEQKKKWTDLYKNALPKVPQQPVQQNIQ